jgi:hypothetical protein
MLDTEKLLKQGNRLQRLKAVRDERLREELTAKQAEGAIRRRACRGKLPCMLKLSHARA